MPDPHIAGTLDDVITEHAERWHAGECPIQPGTGGCMSWCDDRREAFAAGFRAGARWSLTTNTRLAFLTRFSEEGE
jgi:hypothetical protein